MEICFKNISHNIGDIFNNMYLINDEIATLVTLTDGEFNLFFDNIVDNATIDKIEYEIWKILRGK